MTEPSRQLSPIDLLAELGRESSKPMAIPQAVPPVNTAAPPVPDQKPAEASDAAKAMLATIANDQQVIASRFVPREPTRFEDLGLGREEVERLVLKYLLARGSTEGREVAQNLCLPIGILAPLMADLKVQHFLAYRNAVEMGDYEYILTDMGRERARRYTEHCTYIGAAPVCLKDYVQSVKAQTITNFRATEKDLRAAFSDLVISDQMFRRLGPAINSGRGMFLFGAAGNGKTSIAERVTGCFGSSIYVPKAIVVDGDIIRVFDPLIHERIDDAPVDPSAGLINDAKVDTRWVKIRRPTVIAGGELTMAELEVRQNTTTNICEAPMQVKSNCGTLVIDDFGRQRMPVVDLLNRWIVPLEKRYDFLSVPCGKRIQVPFDQIIIFSTNLEPRDLVDAAFLRRIPFKIPVPDPTVEEFHRLFEAVGKNLGFPYDKRAVDYLLAKHYAPIKRPLRACQPRDLLLQVKFYYQYLGQQPRLTPEAIDYACENYFSVM